MNQTRNLYPLSPSQRTLWFLSQLSPLASVAYHVAQVLIFEGFLDTQALQRAFEKLAIRHEVLRAYFVTDADGEPKIALAERHLGQLTTEDLPPGEDPRLAAARRTAELNSLPFDLAEPPLLRTVLLRAGEHFHCLVLIGHHTILDGWSLALLLQELRVFYRAERRGEPADLPPLSKRFVELVAPDAAEPDAAGPGEAFQRALAASQARLEGAPTLLELPLDRPRPLTKSYLGGDVTLRLDRATTEEIRAFARRHRVTFFSPLCAAFSTLLWRLSGQNDLLIGTPAAVRPTTAHEAVIGPLINSLVLRVGVDPREGFGALLPKVQRTLFDALGETEVPFAQLVKALQPERRDDRDPVFQVMFSLLPADTSESFFDDGLRSEPLEWNARSSQFDLTLMVVQGLEGETTLSFNYDSTLFERETIQLLAARTERILRAGMTDPQQPLAGLPWQSPVELERITRLSQRRDEVPRRATLLDFLAGRRVLTPQRPALVVGENVLSYAELIDRARLLASALQAQGAGPDVPVGLLLERDLDLPIALLGILSAGAAYLPLDPAYPADRLRYVLESSAAPLLLTRGKLAAQLGLEAIPGCRILDLDALEAAPAPARPLAGPLALARPLAKASPENLAYVLYTSGSTGKPKGVAITHRSLINFLVSMAKEPGLAPDDVLLAITTLSFDIAGLELFLPLVCGAKCVLIGRQEATDAEALAAAIDRHGATVLQATPATWQMLLAAGWQGRPGLKAICGGEGLPTHLAEALLERVDTLWNVYGPTETTIWSAAKKVEKGRVALLGEKTVTLGRPIANTDLHVVDQGGAVQAIGVPGELLIGGDGLARGYWRRPELTAERFVPDPFSGRPGARLYRTGDLARWRIDGELEFLGRLDFQVKVRGFRIELAEIEATLAQFPGVAEAVVVARGDSPSGNRLVGYFRCPDSGSASPPTSEELQTFLRRSLPEYMVPPVLVQLERFPLTPNLKIDRKALPVPETKTRPVRLPESRQEKILAGIWQELLALATAVGVEDNFFALGGDSIVVNQVVARAREQGLELRPLDLFLAPNLAALAATSRDIAPAAPAPVAATERQQGVAIVGQLSEDDLADIFDAFGRSGP